MPLNESESTSAAPTAALILVPLGLIFIFTGLCVGLWMLHIAYTALYQPENIPLIGKVLTLIGKDDAIIEQIKIDDGVRWQGAGVRYGVLMLLFLIVLASIGSVIRAFIGAGSALIQAASNKPAADAKAIRQKS
jgi:hypothetical protein